jgi:hypothetical protein
MGTGRDLLGGTELLEEFAEARNNKEFNQALNAVATGLKEHGLDVGHGKRKIKSAIH